MKMRPVPSITIPPGQSVALKPHGYHLMLIGLKAPLKQGERLPVTMTFARAGAQQVTVTVVKAGGAHAGDMSTRSSGSAG